MKHQQELTQKVSHNPVYVNNLVLRILLKPVIIVLISENNFKGQYQLMAC